MPKAFFLLPLLQYMNIESSFEGKDFVCGRMLQYLMQAADGASEELHSFHLLEALLFRVQLSLFTGRRQNALDILQVPSPILIRIMHSCRLSTNRLSRPELRNAAQNICPYQ